jgi:uncharacterized damage-inducible protein DinB
MKDHFESLIAYNAWANRRLYGDAASLSDDERRADVGVYFKSLHGTLAHLLQTDRAWTFILQGGELSAMALPPAPEAFTALQAARVAQDQAFIAWIGGVDEAWLAQPFRFTSGLASLKGMTYTGTHASTLTHLLNHQTHHRGQAHAALTRLGVAEPASLDVLMKGFLGE